MREIKFRVFSSYMYSHDQCITQGLDPRTTVKINTNNCYWMQYTGLKDSTGKEIYEGDYFKRIDTGCTYLVMWYKDRFLARKVYDNWLKREVINEKKDSGLYFMTTYKIEIVGNIHENPELL